jgi:hypothetical protein
MPQGSFAGNLPSGPTNLVDDRNEPLAFALAPTDLVLDVPTAAAERVAGVEDLDDDVALVDDLAQVAHKGLGRRVLEHDGRVERRELERRLDRVVRGVGVVGRGARRRHRGERRPGPLGRTRALRQASSWSAHPLQ